MKLNKDAKKLAEDLGLDPVDAYIMDLKAKLYSKSAELISSSKLTHEEIATIMGTSRARICRISKMGEINVSIEILIKIIATLENEAPIKFVA